MARFTPGVCAVLESSWLAAITRTPSLSQPRVEVPLVADLPHEANACMSARSSAAVERIYKAGNRVRPVLYVNLFHGGDDR